MSRQNGKSKLGKINIFDDSSFPDVSRLIKGMNETQKRALDAIINKDPEETWPDVAQRVGITDRQLRNIRNEPKIQEACYLISKQLFQGDVPDVLKVLTRKAKSGNAWAVKLFLEVSGELKQPADKPLSAEDLPDLSDIPTEQNLESLLRALKLSSDGITTSRERGR